VHERLTGADSERRGGGARASAARAPSGAAASTVQALQRAAGNRATTRLVRRALQRAPDVPDPDSPDAVDAERATFYFLDDWLRRGDRSFMSAATLARIRALRDARRPAVDAMARIDDFERRRGPLAFNVSREQVARRLRRILCRPELLQQGQYLLCGPDVFLRIIALRHPDLYANYVIDLV
jgi:hypothetical protein